MEIILLGVLILLVLVVICLQIGKAAPSDSPQLAILRDHMVRLAPVVEGVHSVQLGLSDLRAYVSAREDMERRTADSIRRLELVIAGTQSRGEAGENVLETVFGTLPAEWQVRNFRVGDKHVEFGVRLPNGLVLPIDSKWAATNLLERFTKSADQDERRRLKNQIESTVADRARELQKYIHPSLTVPFGIAAVPDSVYDVCLGKQAELFQQQVVMVPYSMFVPYLLLVFQTALKMSQNVDLHELSAQLDAAEGAIRGIQEELNGRFSRALTMLANSRDDISAHLGRASVGLTTLRLRSESRGELAPAGDLAR